MGMDSLLPNNTMRPAAAALSQTAGDWRLDRLPRSRTVFLALALSAGVHAAFLLAFNQPGPRTILVPLRADPPIKWTWRDDTDPPPSDPEVIALKDPPPVNLPRQLDIPSPVDLHPDFVVPLQPPAPVTALSKETLLRIPTNINSDSRPPGSENIFDVKQLGRAPRAIAQPAPRFPLELQHEVASAELVVEFIVDTSGSVRNATIVSSTHHGFDRATLDGVRQWKFQPGLKDGRKVNTRIRQPIRFAMDDIPGT